MKKYNIIFSVVVVLFLMTSCEDFLTQKPALEETTELSLSTYDGMLKAAVGAYGPMYGASWYGRDFPVTADLKGGNSKISPITSGRFVTEYLWNNTPTATIGLWTNAYDVIARANNVINAMEGFEEPGVEQEDLDALQGECRFLRALAHFDMARTYCKPYGEGRDNLGVPVILVTELGKPARNTVGETYDQIVADLQYAVANMSDSPLHASESGDPKGWATKNAAKALLARVYLYMEDWQNAADMATEVIDAGYDLYTPAEYTTWDNGGVWGTDAASEIIFEVFGNEGNSWHPNWDQITYIMSPNGYGDIGASKDVIDAFEASDVRGALFVEPSDYPDNFWSLKYPGKGGNLRIDNIPVLRISEMYLIRAEAILNGASVAGVTAASDLDAIRSNRGASNIANPTLADIYQERRLELCYEGHEMFDLARTGRGLTRVDFDGAVNQNINYPDYRWAMPIPQGELDANPNVEQNPGYSSN